MKEKNETKVVKENIYTLTFSECVENHVGMQMIGKKALNGYSYEDLCNVYNYFESLGADCMLIHLNDYLPSDLQNDFNEDLEAYILVVTNGVKYLGLSANALYDEQQLLVYDTKALMKKKVVNKRMRYNLCFADKSQDAEYELGKGTIIEFKKLKLLNKLRKCISKYIDPNKEMLYAEGNKYHINEFKGVKRGIGFHGDSERRKVIGIRLGGPFKLIFQWYQESKSVSEEIEIVMNSGDLYMMSDLAVGWNWKRKLIPTLRHCAHD